MCKCTLSKSRNGSTYFLPMGLEGLNVDNLKKMIMDSLLGNPFTSRLNYTNLICYGTDGETTFQGPQNLGYDGMK